MSERLYTRAEAVELLRNEFGLILTPGSLQCGGKKIAPCGSPYEPPKPATRSGRHSLYRAADLRKWAKVLIDRRRVA